METKKSKPKRLKRPYSTTDSDTDSDCEVRAVSGHWPRWLVVRAADESRPLSGLSPFAIAKALKGMAGEPKQVKKMRDGSLLVEMSTKNHAELLLKTRKLVDCPVTVSPHRTMNSSKGVIRSRDLRMMSEAEIKEELSTIGVIHVHRVTIRKGSERVPTDTLFLTFDSPTLPKEIKACWTNIKVTPYVPAPLRCFKCQKFGHVRDRCPGREVCGKCAQDLHEGPCTGSEKCVNCEAAHPSFSRACPEFIKERDIQEIRVQQKSSYFEARDIYKQRHPVPGTSYASAVSGTKTTANASCQTNSTRDVGCLTTREVGCQTDAGANEADLGSKPSSQIPSSSQPAQSSSHQKSQTQVQPGPATAGRASVPQTSNPKNAHSKRPPTAPKPTTNINMEKYKGRNNKPVKIPHGGPTPSGDIRPQKSKSEQSQSEHTRSTSPKKALSDRMTKAEKNRFEFLPDDDPGDGMEFD